MRSAGALALLFAYATAARAGTYGSESRGYPGFIASIDCSVGHSSDHRDEGERYRRKREDARVKLEAADLQLQRMYRHFSTGTHPRARLRGLLASTLAVTPEWDHLVHVEVGGIRVTLFLTRTVSDAVAAKLAADFAAAQLTTGGALATPGTGAADPAALGELEQRLAGALLGGGTLIHTDLYQLLNESRRAEPALRALARLDGPVPVPSAGLAPYARSGWLAAQIIVSALDGKPGPAALHARLATLEPEPRAGAIRLMALLLPDGEWAAGLPALRRDAGADAPLIEWLDQLTR